MATPIPLRSVRIPALQQQCLFQRRRCLLDRPFVASSARKYPSASTRAFSTTPSLCSKNRQLGQDRVQTRAAIQSQVAPSPKVNIAKQQSSVEAMQEDIGLLQGTVIRAPFSKLPSIRTRRFWGYLWGLVKSKGTALYSRSYYHRCMSKNWFWGRIPIDSNNKTQLKYIGKQLYEQINTSLALGDTSPIRKFCLEPLLRKIKDQKSDTTKSNWKIHKWNSVRIVSHRASPLGEDHPDTAYRQLVLRLESIQSLRTSARNDSPDTMHKGRSGKRSSLPLWVPDEKRAQVQVQRTHLKQPQQGQHNGMKKSSEVSGKHETVVAYMVMQRRVIRGVEEDWKVWGFTNPTTPQVLKSDEEYWRKTLNETNAEAEAA